MQLFLCLKFNLFNMKKFELRTLYKKKRKSLSEEEILDRSKKILNQARNMPIWNKDYYHIFLPIERHFEVNTWPFIHFIREELKKTVVVPKTNFNDFSLEHIKFDVDTVTYKNKFGIPEPIRGIQILPENLDIVFVPLFTFDKEGNRVGFGKGFYDRFLKKCTPDTLFIGLTLFDEMEEIDDVHNLDQVLHYCISPNKVYSFIDK